MPPRPCTNPRCGAMAVNRGRCADHQEVWNHNGKTRHERGYGNDWDIIRAKVLKRDKCQCQECLLSGIFTRASEVDHIIPKTLGGANALNNLRSLCYNCHLEKSLVEASNARNSKQL